MSLLQIFCLKLLKHRNQGYVQFYIDFPFLLENLIKYDFVDKTQGTRYTALQFEKIGNVGHVFLDIPSGVSNTLNDGALLFNFPEKYRPKTFNLKIIISYSNGMTARTRYDANTGNLYILSKILVPESMYLDTFYFLD